MVRTRRLPESALRLPPGWDRSWRRRVGVASLREAMGAGIVRRTVDDLGRRLVATDYGGPEISPGHAPKQLSTTLSAALSGWLRRRSEGAEALTRAQYCLELILDEQTDQGAWLFPYPFRENGAGHAYACEMLMTMSGLLDAVEEGLGGTDARAALVRAIEFLRGEIGWSDDGAFWYSATDHILVPNISSMVASVFARSARALAEPSLRDDALRAFDYCLRTQAEDGAYPYFTDQPLVYIPYHALQVWHLCIASRCLSTEIDPGIDRAVQYLDGFVRTWGYCPTNAKASPWVAKTPLWTAMAFLQYGNRRAAIRHYLAARLLFWNAEQRTLFYTLDLHPRIRERLDTVYPRYIASAFEIGASLSGQDKRS